MALGIKGRRALITGANGGMGLATAKLLQDAGVDRWMRGQEHASDHAPTWISLAREAD